MDTKIILKIKTKLFMNTKLWIKITTQLIITKNFTLNVTNKIGDKFKILRVNFIKIRKMYAENYFGKGEKAEIWIWFYLWPYKVGFAQIYGGKLVFCIVNTNIGGAGGCGGRII